MDYKILGRTGLKVSAMGVGCGGPSRVGQRSGKTEAESIFIIRQAMDLGINFIDTAEDYGTEEIVGKALNAVDRHTVILSTKKATRKRINGNDLQKGLDNSLKRLGTDYIDIYNLHSVLLEDYAYIVTEIVPVMQKMREQGKIRFIGITEWFNNDPQHTMLQRALQDNMWDTVMVGFNILNQSARDSVFKKTIEKNIGVMVMFAVRLAFSNPARLKQIIEGLIQKKQLDPACIDANDPLGFLIHEGGAVSLTDAAYRFCHYEPGTNVILSGTGHPDHLQQNITSFDRRILPAKDLRKIRDIFRNVNSVSGE